MIQVLGNKKCVVNSFQQRYEEPDVQSKFKKLIVFSCACHEKGFQRDAEWIALQVIVSLNFKEILRTHNLKIFESQTMPC